MRFIENSASTTLPAIVIPAGDYERLTRLAASLKRSAPQVFDYLTQELDRADIVTDNDCGRDVVRVGSMVTYSDGLGGRARTVQIVWPHEVDLNRSRISVLSLIGAALLGMRPAQSIEWPSPVGGPRALTVMNVYNGAPLPVA